MNKDFERKLNAWANDIGLKTDLMAGNIASSKDKQATLKYYYLATRNNSRDRSILMFIVNNKYPELKCFLEKLMILE